MNYRKKGLNKLLELILRKQMKRLVITHKDRLLRFGAELAQDVLEIITVFSARLYGSRSKKHKQLMEDLKDVAGS